MPELPEVEAARALIHNHLVGKRISCVRAAADDKVFVDGCNAKLEDALKGRTVAAARRKGKYLWLQLDGEGPLPVLHFGMAGGIVVKGVGASKYKRMHLESDPDTWPPKYCKLELDFEGGGQLAFVDQRRFARVWLQADPAASEPLSKLGFDVQDQLPDAAGFAEAVRKRVARAPAMKIKALLLDQEFCSGIGNWVGDEVLYLARVHPEESAQKLSDEQLCAIHDAIQRVVRAAVEVDADSGRFPKEWLFHYRWTNKKAGDDAHGNAIEFVTVGSRTSAFVPALQVLSGGGGAAPAKSKAKAKGKPAGGDEDDGAEAAEGATGARAKPARRAAAARAATARGAKRKAKEDEEDEDEDEPESDEGDDSEPPSEDDDDDDDDSDGGGRRKKAKKAKKAAPKKKPAEKGGRK